MDTPNCRHASRLAVPPAHRAGQQGRRNAASSRDGIRQVAPHNFKPLVDALVQQAEPGNAAAARFVHVAAVHGLEIAPELLQAIIKCLARIFVLELAGVHQVAERDRCRCPESGP